jgi:hypothetical protein
MKVKKRRVCCERVFASLYFAQNFRIILEIKDEENKTLRYVYHARKLRVCKRGVY